MTGTYAASRKRNEIEIRRLTGHIYVVHTGLPSTRSMVLIKTTRPTVAIYSGPRTVHSSHRPPYCPEVQNFLGKSAIVPLFQE